LTDSRDFYYYEKIVELWQILFLLLIIIESPLSDLNQMMLLPLAAGLYSCCHNNTDVFV